MTAVELLLSGETEAISNPDMSRGLIAVLNYYNSQKIIVESLRNLLQSKLILPADSPQSVELLNFIESYCDNLFKNQLFSRLLNLIKSLNVNKEIEMLENQKALGTAKHRRRFITVFGEIKTLLGECVMLRSLRSPLNSKDSSLFIKFMRELYENSNRDAEGDEPCVSIDHTFVHLLVGLLNSINPLVGGNSISNYPKECFNHSFFTDDEYIRSINDLVRANLIDEADGEHDLTTKKSVVENFDRVLYLAWTISLQKVVLLKQEQSINSSGFNRPTPLDFGDFEDLLEYDSSSLDSRIVFDCFSFLRRLTLLNGFHDEHIWIRCIHDLVTDFIVYMPKLVRDLRTRVNVVYFSSVLELIGGLHGAPERLSDWTSKDTFNGFLENLTLEFWCPQEIMSGSDMVMNTGIECMSGDGRDRNWVMRAGDSYRQATLFKFIRDCGDLFDYPELFVNYIYMLKGLCNSERVAVYIYKMLNSNQIGLQNSKLTWLWFTSSMNQHAKYYLSNPHKTLSMDPMELDGLLVVLQLIKRVTKMSPRVCEVMLSNESLMLVQNLILMLSCGVPKLLKAELLNCLAVLCQNAMVAKSIWQSLDSNKIITSSPESNSCSILLELSEMEPKHEEFYVTRAFLNFLWATTPHIMCDITILDQSAGNYDRLNSSIVSTPTHYSMVENLTLVIQTVMDNVFIKHLMRTYRNIEEKFAICGSFLQLCCKCVELFLCQTGSDKHAKSKLSGYEHNPGFFIVNQLLNETAFFNTVLNIITSGYSQITDALNNVTFGSKTFSKEAVELQGTSISLAMDLISIVLKNETFLMEIVSKFNSQVKSENHRFGQPFLRPRNSCSQELSLLLMRSCAEPFLPNLVNYISLVDENEKVARKALNIFNHCVKLVQPHSNLMLMLTNVNDLKLLPLMVNCIDKYGDIDGSIDEIIASGRVARLFFDDGMQDSPRTSALKILVNCLQQPTPNIGQYLCGFSCGSVFAVKRTCLQEAGVGDFPKTCLHSILNLIQRLVSDMTSSAFNDISAEYLSVFTVNMIDLSLAYHILFLLASNSHTSTAVLRFIRSNYQFLFNQFDLLAVNASRLVNIPELRALIWNQKSWLLKIVAIEIRTCTANQQRLHLTKLLKLIFGEDFYSPNGGSNQMTWLSPEENCSYDGLIYQILEDLEVTEPERVIDFFSCQRLKPEILKEYLNESVEDTYMGVRLMNATRLKQMIFADINFTVDEEQFQILEKEIDNICGIVDHYNTNTIWLQFGKSASVDAWGQVVEVVMLSESSGDGALDLETKRRKLFEILEVVNDKMTVSTVPSCLITPFSRVCVVLSAVFARMFVDKRNKTSLQSRIMPSDEVSNLEENQLESIDLDNLYEQLRRLLKLTMKCIMEINYKFQNTRIKFYAVFTHLLEIALTISNIKPNFSKIIHECHLAINNHSLLMETVAEKSFYSTVCCDCTSGNFHLTLSSLTLLDCIASIDRTGSGLVSYLVNHGYLNHFIDGLIRDCDHIFLNMKHAHDTNYLRESDNPNDLIPYNLFLSRMSLLCKLASQPMSAKALVQCGVLSKLAQCNLFRTRPVLRNSNDRNLYGDDDNMEDNSVQYRNVVSYAVQLVNNILSTLGLDKSDAVREVLIFIGESIDNLCEPFYTLNNNCPASDIKEMVEISNLFVLLVPGILKSRSLEEVEYKYRTLEKMKRASAHVMANLLGLLNKPIHNEEEMLTNFLQIQLMCNVLSVAAGIIAPGSNETQRLYFSSSVDDVIGGKHNWSSAIRKICQSVSSGNKPPLSLLVIVLSKMQECYENISKKLVFFELSDYDVGLQISNGKKILSCREVEERMSRMSNNQLQQLWNSVFENVSSYQNDHMTSFVENIDEVHMKDSMESELIQDLTVVYKRMNNLLSSIAGSLETCCFLLWNHVFAYKSTRETDCYSNDTSLHPIQRLQKIQQIKLELDQPRSGMVNEDISMLVSKCVDDELLHRIQATVEMHFSNEEGSSFTKILIHRLMRMMKLC